MHNGPLNIRARTSNNMSDGHLFIYRTHNTLTAHDNGTMIVSRARRIHISTYLHLMYIQIRLSGCVNTLLYRRYGSLFALNAPNAFLAVE